MPSGTMKNATTIASAGAESASPTKRPRRSAADDAAVALLTSAASLAVYAMQPSRVGRSADSPRSHPRAQAPRGAPAPRLTSLFQYHPLVSLDDVGEVLRQRERPAILREIRRRDIGEE